MSETMKSIAVFLRSMKFGFILLSVICVCSLFGSLFPQGREAAFYAVEYPSCYGLILSLGLDRVFSGPFFLALLACLCLNLAGCSISRFSRTRGMAAVCLEKAFSAVADRPLSREQGESLARFLESRRFTCKKKGDVAVYHKNDAGLYGSFLMHLSILLVLVFASLAQFTAKVADYPIMPGDAVNLPDGTAVLLENFRITDARGRTDYASTLRIMAPDGATAGPVEVRVNQPASFKGKKYFQQNYGQAGRMTIRNNDTGAVDRLTLTEASAFALDSRLSLTYLGIDGDAIDQAAPVRYRIAVANKGAVEMRSVAPEGKVRLGSVDFFFEEPVYYPGIRVKTELPGAIPTLYMAFALMILSLWLCFFHAPVYVTLNSRGVAVSGKNRLNFMNDLDARLSQA